MTVQGPERDGLRGAASECLQTLRTFPVGIACGVSAALLAGSQVTRAHGDPAPEPSLSSIFTAWSSEPLAWIAILAAAIGYLFAVRLVNRAHATPVAPFRVSAWFLGLAVIGIALVSPVDVYSDDLLSVHMVQHLLLAMVAPPLLALGAPLTLILRVSRPSIRRSSLLPILRSPLVQLLSWPPIGWVAFAVVMWATHFSPLFNAAMEDSSLHIAEHSLYLAAGLLFWWPVIGADPSPRRLRPVARMAYLAAQMPLNTAVGLAIYFAPSVLYAHYATRVRTWGPDPFTDQQVAGIIMWGVGDVVLLAALVLAVAAWLRAEEKGSRKADARGARNVESGPVETP